MDHVSSYRLEKFKMTVGTKFQLYNSLFTSLPFHRIEKTGILLSLFLVHCEDGYKKVLSPAQIVKSFFEKYTFLKERNEQLDLLFRFVQYAERQVVLFDAVEDAAFEDVNDLSGAGTIKQLLHRISQEDKTEAFLQKLQQFAVTLVLTAHPTQFYPGSVLGIINDLSTALHANDAVSINSYLQQLGKTPLFKQQKPTPFDEAVSLIWYLENVFYDAIGNVLQELKQAFPEIDFATNPVIRMGFWPGGDRDGNPNVTADTTVRVATALHASLVRCYYNDVRRLKRRITFKGVDTIIANLDALLYQHTYAPSVEQKLTKEALLQPLQQIREQLVYEHNNLFVSLVDALINKVHAFGIHFATLDVRQESSVHATVLEAIGEKENSLANYANKTEEEKLQAIANLQLFADAELYSGMVKETLLSVDAVYEIQAKFGEQACHRYIISQCQSALNVLEVYALFLLRGKKAEEINIDIVPLFETVEDLRNAPQVMKELYANPLYASHLKRRGMKQVMMVGFSDGTKDGGYLMANWSIYQAKTELTRISREAGVSVVFFDGRGGPPARGGGKTHKFYASMGKAISTDEIQLTVQGQTVSSNFGIISAAQYNIEQMLNAGVVNELFAENDKGLQPEQLETLRDLSELSFQSYTSLKEHPDFMDYLSEVSPLRYYSETNISSRPAKRNPSSRLTLKDLRAIPFVGAWSQIKQNVPGYFGLGTALEAIEAKGKFGVVKHIYSRSAYFRTLIENCEMAMIKSYFPLTAYLAKDEKYSGIWSMIVEEYERTQRCLQKLSGSAELMSNYPVDQLSIQMRERIVLPLTTIQQYALQFLRSANDTPDGEKETYEKLVIRSSFGIINAGRNSV
ncbi:MAG TPA: phosphoenolpyruvate carboxylase [Flavisolibacter sp.]|nr:phosphoenolpyruvate carboxylase [Flavisolibacter sp.]